MSVNSFLYPAFKFESQQDPQPFVELAEKYDLSLAFWRVGPVHLYVYQVPLQRDELGQTLYDSLRAAAFRGELGRFTLGYVAGTEWIGMAQLILHRSTEEERLLRIGYPPPWLNGNCACAGNPFCPAGHMMECHYPMSCSDAGCGHLESYDYPAVQAQQVRCRARRVLLARANPGCERCAGQGTTFLDVTAAQILQRPVADEWDLNVPIQFTVLCDCVVNAVRARLQSRKAGRQPASCN